jgi:predicted enzyme related to lactoylglutathione lyase
VKVQSGVTSACGAGVAPSRACRADVNDVLKRVEASAGSVVRPKTEIPGVGHYAHAKDTEGDVVGGVWQNLG